MYSYNNMNSTFKTPILYFVKKKKKVTKLIYSLKVWEHWQIWKSIDFCFRDKVNNFVKVSLTYRFLWQIWKNIDFLYNFDKITQNIVL